MAEHHHRFWRWVWALEAGVRPATVPVLLWPRGGAKSTSAELGCAAVAARKARQYTLYVSGKQSQADDHVGNVAALLESKDLGACYPDLGQRMLNKFGSSQGWRRNRIRTASGFTVDALGLDVAARGVKLNEQRPDLIIFDDVDDTADSPETVEKKVTAITQKILPAEAPYAAAAFVQNLVHYESVAARLAGLASKPADFLTDRDVSGPIPAVVGLQTERVPGTLQYRIVTGTPTWAGQSIETSERQINRWGLRAFLAEAQHERTPPEGQAFPEFDRSIHVCEPFKIPEEWPRWTATDYGYSSNYGNLWLTRAPAGRLYVYRERYGTRKTAREQAYDVRLASAGEKIRFNVGDPSMWASQREGEKFQSVADQYGEMGVKLTPASNDRLAGKSRVHDVLDHAEGAPPVLQIFSTCVNLIRTLPMLPVDPHKPEDVDTLAEDHLYDCVTGDTLVHTNAGRFPISALVGWTGIAYRWDGKPVRFYDVRRVRQAAEVVTIRTTGGQSVTCTPDHLVMMANGEWLEAGSITPGGMIHCGIIDAWTQQSSPTRSKSSRGSDSTSAESISSTTGSGSMWLSGRQSTAPFQQGTISTIGMLTGPTTDSATWKLSRADGISATILPVPVSVNVLPDVRMPSRHPKEIDASRSSSAAMLCSADGRITVEYESPVRYAGKDSIQPFQAERSSVVEPVRREHFVVADVKSAPPADVYDLSVDDPSHSFIVNDGITVHNCLRYGLMAAPWLDALKRRGPESYSMGGRR